MASIPNDMLDEIGKARVGGGGNYINHGHYVVQCDKWFYQKIQDRCIIFEMLVVEARPNPVFEGERKVEQEPNPVGSSMSDTSNFDGDGKLSAPANSRAPVLGLFDLKETDTSQAAKVQETLKYCTEDAQPARGMLQYLSTYPKKIRTPKPGGPTHITARDYKCLSKPGYGVNTPEKVKARLDALARSPEEWLRVAQQHLAEFRAASANADAPNAPAVSAFAPATPAIPAIPEIPVIPTVPAIPTAPAVPWYVADGWKQHPQNPLYFFKSGEPVQLEADLIAMKR